MLALLRHSRQKPYYILVILGRGHAGHQDQNERQ
jgi:hypothetical protein